MNSRKFFQDTIVSSLWIILSRFIGVLIPLLLAYWFGVNQKTDQLFLAYSCLFFIFAIISNSIRQIILPFIIEKGLRSDETGYFLGSLATKVSVFYLLVNIFIFCGIGIFFWESLMEHESKNQLFSLFYLFGLPMVLISFWSFSLVGLLEMKKLFWITTPIASVKYLVTIILILLLKKYIGIFSVMIGYSIGELVSFIVLVLVSYRMSLPLPKWTMKMMSGPGIPIRPLFQYAFFAGFLYLIPLIDRVTAGYLPSGSVSIVYYVDVVFNIFFVLLMGGIGTILPSYWVSQFFEEGREKLLRSVRHIGFILFSSSLIISIAVLLTKKWIVNLLFSWGKITIGNIAILSELIGIQIVALAPLVIVFIISKYYLARKQNSFLMVTGIIGIFLKIAGNCIGVKVFGINGIFYSSVISFSLMAIVMVVPVMNVTKAEGQ